MKKRKKNTDHSAAGDREDEIIGIKISDIQQDQQRSGGWLDNDNLPKTQGRTRGQIVAGFTGFTGLVRLRINVYGTRVTDHITWLIHQEREAGTLFHFAPVCFGLGIATYYTIPNEPVLPVLLATFILLLMMISRMRVHRALWATFVAGALFVGGMSASALRMERLDMHSLAHRITGNISGTIVEVSRNQRGFPRYLIRPNKIEKLTAEQLPNFIRLSAASKHKTGKPGDLISGLARLQPISGPAYPGSFDFSFKAWHEGMGGSGFFMGKPELIEASNNNLSVSFFVQLRIYTNRLRGKIAARIYRALPGETGDVATALITGDRTGISRRTQESLRQSGLAHVLAISGMHMALVSLTMVWAVRFLLALNMRLSVRYSIKNWAALAGFITASSYLAISGLGVATQRAWIMISVMMIAAILSRKSVTLRGVALAAMIILILQPESILSPGFQMSFAAVAGIVAAYEFIDTRRKRKYEGWRSNRVFRFFGTLIFTSLIAGLATSLFAAYHFHRVAPLGVLTNLLAMPLVSIIIMPMALLAMIMMPYGFEHYALGAMGAGIEQVIVVSDYVNTLGVSGVSGHLGGPVLPMAIIGLFLLTMLKTPLRISGFVILLASTFFWSGSPVPDILLSEDGRAIAIRDEQRKLAPLYPRRNKFVRDIWLRAYSNDRPGNLLGKGRCDKDFCSARTRQGAVVVVVYAPAQIQNACNHADILLAPKLRWINCYGRKPSLIIKRGQLEEFGAHAIYLTNTQTRENQPVPTKTSVENRNRQKNSDIQSNQANNPNSIVPTAFTINRIETAISNSNRPWNNHREGRAKYLQD